MAKLKGKAAAKAVHELAEAQRAKESAEPGTVEPPKFVAGDLATTDDAGFQRHIGQVLKVETVEKLMWPQVTLRLIWDADPAQCFDVGYNDVELRPHPPVTDARGVAVQLGDPVHVASAEAHRYPELSGRTGRVVRLLQNGEQQPMADVLFLESFTKPATETRLLAGELVVSPQEEAAAPAPAPATPPVEAAAPAVDEVREVPMVAIIVGSNLRKAYDENEIIGLAQSIAEMGLINPITLRPHPEQPDHYDLVAGHRRYLAQQLNGATSIRATVRSMTDLQRLQIQILENLQRKDINPVDEAQGFRQLLDEGMTAEEIALRVGHSVKFVLLRVRLAQLDAAVLDMLSKRTLSIGGALEVAVLPPDAQVAFAERHQQHINIKASDVRGYIKRNVLLDLNQAKFPKQDPTLNPEMGPCTTCSFRTGANALLFEELSGGKDMCLKKACFQVKQQAYLVWRNEELRLKHGDQLLLVSGDWYTPNEAWLGSGHYNTAKPDDVGARPALLMDSVEAGKLFWVKVNKVHLPSGQERTPAEQKAQRKAELRESRIKKRHDVLMAAGIAAHVGNTGVVPTEFLTKQLRGEIIRYGGPDKLMRKMLVAHFGFKMPAGGTDKCKESKVIEAWVNENLQAMTNPQRLGLYVALIAYNHNYYGGSSSLSKLLAESVGDVEQDLLVQATELEDGKPAAQPQTAQAA